MRVRKTRRPSAVITTAVAPLLNKAQCFQALQSNPIKLGNLKLGFSGLLQGPLLGRTKIWRRFHAGALTRGHAARSAAGWRSAPLFALGLLLVR